MERRGVTSQGCLVPSGEKQLGLLLGGLLEAPRPDCGRVCSTGLQRVYPEWLEEQFSQQPGLGPDLSVAGVEGASGLD